MAERDERKFESAPREYTEAELTQLRATLLRAVSEEERLKADKKQKLKEFEAEIHAQHKVVIETTGDLVRGYAIEEVQVETLYDEPRPGIKTTVRADNLKPLREEPMTWQEKQRQFHFPEDDRPDTKGAPE